MKIGIWARQEDPLWVAGSIYQQNLIASLGMIEAPVEVALLVRQRTPEIAAQWAAGIEIIEVPEPTSPWRRGARRLRRMAGWNNRPLDDFFRAAGVDVVFGNLRGHGPLETPWLTRITDFQFLHLPENFTPQDAAGRREAARLTAEAAAHILVSGPSVYKDLEQLFPELLPKVSVVPFVSLFPSEFYAPEPSEEVARFHLRRPFLVVPTQWWKHKNHQNLLVAAARLEEAGTVCHWVMTGTIFDPRAPRYYSRLLQQIAALGLNERIVVLGFLPRKNQVQLLRAADGIVQPSLFEGFSISVEDAKTLGQRIALSDISAHRERDPRHGFFFDPHSVEDMARQIARLLEQPARPPAEREAEGRREALERARRFGEDFYRACEKALAN